MLSAYVSMVINPSVKSMLSSCNDLSIVVWYFASVIQHSIPIYLLFSK